MLVYGESDEELKIVNKFQKFPELGYKVISIISRNGSFEIGKNTRGEDTIKITIL